MWLNTLLAAFQTIPWEKIPWEKIPWHKAWDKIENTLSKPKSSVLSKRLDVVEESVKLSTEASKNLAEEIKGLSSATEILASRIMWALLLSSASLLISLICLIRVFWR